MKAIELAKHIINYAISINRPVSNVQLQKILYFVDLFYLLHNNERLISDGNFVAWKYGPVMESVYYKFREYGAFDIVLSEKTDENLPENFKDQIIGYVDNLIRNYTPWDLVELSHLSDTPWSKTQLNSKISNELMEEYVKKFIK